MTWASVARGDHRRRSEASPSNGVTPNQPPKPAPVRSVAVASSHIAGDAWPLVGQTAEDARRGSHSSTSTNTISTSVSTATTGTAAITIAASTSTSTATNNVSTGVPPAVSAVTSTRNPASQAPGATTTAQGSNGNVPRMTSAAVPAPARPSVWGPPDPPCRPPSTTGAPPASGASPGAAAQPQLDIPPSDTASGADLGSVSRVTDTFEATGAVPTTADSGAMGATTMRDPLDNVRMRRVQDYYVAAFQGSPTDFLANFFTNMAFQAGVLSAGLNPECSDQCRPKLLNYFSNFLGNDPVFYHSSPAAQPEWSSPSPPASSRQSPRSAPPNCSAPQTAQQQRRYANSGRHRHHPNQPNGDVQRDSYRAAEANPPNGFAHPPPSAPPYPGSFNFLPRIRPLDMHMYTVSSRVTSRLGFKPPLVPHIPVTPPHLVSIVDRECDRIALIVRTTDEETKRRRSLITQLQKVVQSEWAGASVSCFGSAANGLALRNGDVDICLMIPKGSKRIGGTQGLEPEGSAETMESAENEVQVLYSIKKLLAKSHMVVVQDLCHARVPILKLSDPATQFQIDICVNNRLVDHNTALVSTYMQVDPRVQKLCLLIKNWTKSRDINTTYRGTLSSYAWVLLVICFLQTRSPPVLPCLQRMVNGKVVSDDEIPKKLVQHADKFSDTAVEYNVYFDRNVQWKSHNRESIGQLLIGFFKFYAFDFDYTKSVVSVRRAGFLTREEKKWDVLSVQREAENAEREFRAEKEAMELEEEIAAAERLKSETASVNETPQQSESDHAASNGVTEELNLGMTKTTLDASAAPFLPLSPSATENGGGSTNAVANGHQSEQQQEEVQSAVASSSTKSASVRSQDSIPSQKDHEEQLVADVAKLASANGTCSQTDRGESVSSSVTSADASPAVPTPYSPSVEQPSSPRSRGQRSGRPRAPSAPAMTTGNTVHQRTDGNAPRLRKPRPVERHAFCIEDPFNLSHDLSRGADEDTIDVIREELYRGYCILSETANVSNVMCPIQFDPGFILARPPLHAAPPQPPVYAIPPPLAQTGKNSRNNGGGSGGANMGRTRQYDRRQGSGGSSGGNRQSGRNRSAQGTYSQR